MTSLNELLQSDNPTLLRSEIIEREQELEKTTSDIDRNNLNTEISQIRTKINKLVHSNNHNMARSYWVRPGLSL